MKVSEWIVILGGIILFVVGIGLVLSVVGINWIGAHLEPFWLAILVGIAFIAGGVVLIRGGNISL